MPVVPASRRLWGLGIAVVAALAFLMRLSVAMRGGGLSGAQGYDDGVYFAASSALLWGKVPYADFVLLHPPGIMLILAPFAALGRLTHDALGFEAARVAAMLGGALNAVLVMRISRRAGLAAAVTGGVLYAVWPPVVLSEITGRLEPFVTLGLLGGIWLLTRRDDGPSRRALLLAGAALTAAVSVKIWAVAPAALVVLWVWRRRGTKAMGLVALGGVVTASVIDLPFLLAAPRQMVRMVVLDQIGRGRSPTQTVARLGETLLGGVRLPLDWTPSLPMLALGLVALGVSLLAVWRTHLGRWAVSLLTVELVVLLLSPTFFTYYLSFAGPGLALLVASWVELLGQVRLMRRTAVLSALTGALSAGVALAMLVGILLVVTQDDRMLVSRPFPAQGLAREAEDSRCVTSDSPDALILTNLFNRNMRRGCRFSVDLSGLTYDVDALPLQADGTDVPRGLNVAWQHDLASYLFSAPTTFLMRAYLDGFDRPMLRHLHRLAVLGRGQGLALLGVPERDQHPTAGTTRGRQRLTGSAAR